MTLVTHSDLTLASFRLTPRVEELKRSYFAVMPEICIERARLVTKVSRDLHHFEKSRVTSLDKAQLYRAVFEQRSALVRHKTGHRHPDVPIQIYDQSLLLGSTTTKYKGVILYPEFMAMSIWPELRSISRRRSNPCYIDDADIAVLNREVFPFWMNRNITELLRRREAEAAAAIPERPNQLENIQLLQHLVFFLTDKPNCVSHTVPDFSHAIELGLGALIDEARQRGIAAHSRDTREFYSALTEVLTGIITYSQRLADAAEAEARDAANTQRAAELRHLASLYRRVPEHPAQSFHEGLITIWLCWMAIHLENANVGLSLGRLDQVLYRLYSNDIQGGQLTVAAAIELICCFWLKIGDHVPLVPNTGEQLFGGTGSNQAITIGGVDATGADAVNDLTYVMLRATELLRLRDPNLNARYHSNINSKAYLKRLCDANLSTGATPALHNDRAVIIALMAKGDTLDQARDYAVVGCVEPGSNGRSYGNSAAVLLNLVSALELTLFNGRHRHTGLDRLISIETGDPTNFVDYPAMQKAFATQLDWLVDRSTTLNNAFGQIHQTYHPTPILSALFEGPMTSGKDLVDGGATINSSGATMIGFSDVVDSLSAIEQLVYRESFISLESLLLAMSHDFADDAALLARLRNPEKTPKFGNEHGIADNNAKWLIELLDRSFGARMNCRGGYYRVGYWTMTNHAGFGHMLRATPNGRRTGANLASGLTPVSGVASSLPATLNSVARLPAAAISSGMALNLKYTPTGVDRDVSIARFAHYVEGYFDDAQGTRDGGMEIQFNVTSRETFIDAVCHPEAHRDLLVRVSGYTAYFKDLTPQMQKEIIDRTEYDLLTGQAHAYDDYVLSAGTAPDAREGL